MLAFISAWTLNKRTHFRWNRKSRWRSSHRAALGPWSIFNIIFRH